MRVSIRHLIAATLLPVAGAHAEPAPPTIPTRDVDVTYRMPRPGAEPGAPQLEQRIRWAASAGKERVDSPSRGLYLVVDYRNHTLETIRDADRTVLEMASSSAGIGLRTGAPGQAFVRHGESEVAGLSCTEWDARDNAGQDVRVCITADGVQLRATTGDRVLLEAIKVTYGAIDPAAFAVPDGYTRLAAPPPRSAAPKAPP